jgi:hypothetical protein
VLALSEDGGKRADEAVYVGGRVVRLDRESHEAIVSVIMDWNLDLILVPQTRLERLRRDAISLWQRDCTHLAPPVWSIGRDGSQAGQVADASLRFIHERVAGGANHWPIMFRLELDRGGDAEVGGGIVRAGPLEVILKRRGAGITRAPAPTDDERIEQILSLWARVEEARAFGRAEPFVALYRKQLPSLAVEFR